MKNTKSILITALVTLLSFGSIFYVSCKKDPCAGVTCLNGGTCGGGTCTCPSGYMGSRCQIPPNDAFVGTFTGSGCGETTYIIYYGVGDFAVTMPITIQNTTCSSDYITTMLSGTVSGTTANFATKVFYDHCGNPFAASATAVIVGNFITLNIYVSAGSGGSVSCTFTGSK